MLHGLTLAFDLDGTLVETAPDLIAAANHVFQREGLETVAPHVIRDQISFGARAMIVKGIEHQSARRTAAGIDELLTHFLTHYEANIAVHSRPFPDVLAVLENCRSHGARLVVCTNKRAHLSEELLTALDKRQYFEAIAGRARMEDMKAFFEGVGTGDTAGIREGSPNLRPDFRAQHQKKLDKAAKASKAEEMI